MSNLAQTLFKKKPIGDELTEKQKRLLLELVHRVLVYIRLMGGQGKAKQCADLADVFESLPAELAGIGVFSWSRILEPLKAYREKYNTREDYNFLPTVDYIRNLKD